MYLSVTELGVALSYFIFASFGFISVHYFGLTTTNARVTTVISCDINIRRYIIYSFYGLKRADLRLIFTLPVSNAQCKIGESILISLCVQKQSAQNTEQNSKYSTVSGTELLPVLVPGTMYLCQMRVSVACATHQYLYCKVAVSTDILCTQFDQYSYM